MQEEFNLRVANPPRLRQDTAMGRSNSPDRCAECRMRTALCICELIPRIEVRTRLIVLMHANEIKTTTNTARLACRALQGSDLRIRGVPGQPMSEEGLVVHERQSLLLFPSGKSKELTPGLLEELKAKHGDRPITLIVPDGNWRQASKVARREPVVAEIPHVRLPLGKPSRYQLRQAPNEAALCTFEAIARAMGILEGHDVQDQMERLFDMMVERTLWSKGLLPTERCRFPIPEAAIHGPVRVRG